MTRLNPAVDVLVEAQTNNTWHGSVLRPPAPCLT